MRFNGFSSIGEYEKEARKHGYAVERLPLHRGKKRYFALITTPPTGTATGVKTWHIFDQEETVELLDGFIPSLDMAMKERKRYFPSGVDINFLGTLAGMAMWPDNAEDALNVCAHYRDILSEELVELLRREGASR